MPEGKKKWEEKCKSIGKKTFESVILCIAWLKYQSINSNVRGVSFSSQNGSKYSHPFEIVYFPAIPNECDDITVNLRCWRLY